jgi:hypothetical protein
LVTIVENVISANGRKRRKARTVDAADVLAELAVLTPADHADWSEIRSLLADRVSEGVFAVWLDPLELVATARASGSLLLGCPEGVEGWTFERFAGVLDTAASDVGRRWRPLAPHERDAIALSPTRPSDDPARERPGAVEAPGYPMSHDQKEAS